MSTDLLTLLRGLSYDDAAVTITVMLYYQQRIEEVLINLNTTEHGLTNQQVKANLKRFGPNTIKVKSEPLWRKIIEPFVNVFMAVLFVAAFISLAKKEPLDATIIFVIISVSALIYYVQRFSTERILRALQRRERQAVEVIRDGKSVEISSEKIVPGDILVLHEGEKLPADARLIHVDGLRCDESLLTGESLPISKQVQPLKKTSEVYEQSNMVFQGSFVVSGEARAVVTATGNNTQFGRLAVLSGEPNTSSPVQKKIDKLISKIVIAIFLVSLLAFGLALYRGMEIAEAVRFVLALAVSAVPEGLPVAISVILVLGMRRMAKHKALVRSMQAIENTGVITTIATDKTGTLTKNLLTVQRTWQLDKKVDEASFARHILLATNHNNNKSHDPLDTAMQAFASKHKATLPRDFTQVANMPFDHSFAMSGNVWSTKSGHLAVIKGAPEHVLARSKLNKKSLEEAHHMLYSLTGQGFRVIAVAHAELSGAIKNLSELPKKNLVFDGFIAVADELRRTSKSAVAAAQAAGVTVRMITGDHFETAFAIGKQLGMVEHRNQVFDSRKLAELSDKELSRIIKDVRVFARVIPEHKHRILSLLKKHDVTAMTGDGVNDVPALTNAHIGIAMGAGTQIAKEAGDIILLDNDFKSIVTAIREGRIIFNNIRRMLFYLLATSSGEVLTMLGALIIGLPLPIVAVQILWINLVTDTIMVIPLGLEPGEKHIMKRKPRRPEQPILDPFIISRMLLIALTMAITTLIVFNYFRSFSSIEYARSIAFSILVVMQWANAFNARSEVDSVFTRLRVMNSKFYVGLAIAVTVQMLAMFGPLRNTLHVVPVSGMDVVTTGIIGTAAVLAVSEIHKLVGRMLKSHRQLKYR